MACALSVSGSLADRFIFLGFLPTKGAKREGFWKLVERDGLTCCFFESPKRIRATAAELRERFPTGTVFFGREMTKKFESYHRVPLASLDPEGLEERGEYVVVLEAGELVREDAAWKEEVRRRLLPDKAWAKALAPQFGVSASEIYNALQHERKEM